MRRVMLGFAVGVVLALGAMRLLSAGAPPALPKPGDVITGHDLGFRVERIGNEQVVGALVVRVNGEWTLTEEPSPPSVIPARP
jgi:hypothetical protein